MQQPPQYGQGQQGQQGPQGYPGYGQQPGYPPQQPGHPPQQGYPPPGYPPQQGYPPPGYGGPLPPHQPPKKKKTGLVLGIVGGVVVLLGAADPARHLRE